MTTQHPHAVIAGAGLAGSLAALVLARAGWSVQVAERRGDPRTTDLAEKRSVNLGLSARGLAALDHAGLVDEVLASSVPMRGREIHHGDGETHFWAYGNRPGEVLHSIDRQRLVQILIDAAESTGRVSFSFDTRVVDVLDDGLLIQHLQGAAGASTSTDSPAPGPSQWRADLTIAADGAFSVVRRAKEATGECRCDLTVADWQYKEITIPPGPQGRSRIRLEALHVWPSSDDALIVAHPNVDESLTGTLFLPAAGGKNGASVAELTTAEAVETWMDRAFPGSAELMPDRVQEFLTHPAGQLVTVRCEPWSFGGRTVLIGDAAHGVYPFYGQGMNAAFEDVLVLDGCLRRFAGDLPVALAAFEAERRPHLDVLADLSEANFHELQRTATPMHRVRARLDRVLAGAAPGLWVPLYTMISHRRTPYADALRRARRQEGALAGALCAAALTLGLIAGRRHYLGRNRD